MCAQCKDPRLEHAIAPVGHRGRLRVGLDRDKPPPPSQQGRPKSSVSGLGNGGGSRDTHAQHPPKKKVEAPASKPFLSL